MSVPMKAAVDRRKAARESEAGGGERLKVAMGTASPCFRAAPDRAPPPPLTEMLPAPQQQKRLAPRHMPEVDQRVMHEPPPLRRLARHSQRPRRGRRRQQRRVERMGLPRAHERLRGDGGAVVVARVNAPSQPRHVLAVAPAGVRHPLREPVGEVGGVQVVVVEGDRSAAAVDTAVRRGGPLQRRVEAQVAEVLRQGEARPVVDLCAIAQQDDVVEELHELGARLQEGGDDAEALRRRALAQRGEDLERHGCVEACEGSSGRALGGLSRCYQGGPDALPRLLAIFTCSSGQTLPQLLWGPLRTHLSTPRRARENARS